MPYLLLTEANGSKTTIGIFKRLTSLGRGDKVDINLTSAGFDGVFAYISQSAKAFTLVVPKSPATVSINNLSVAQHELHDHDKFLIENISCQFFLGDPPPITNDIEKEASVVLAYKRMLDFSKTLAKEKDIGALLKKLLQEITQLTGAEHGFLVLIEDGKPTVKVSEPNNEDEHSALIGPMSDSIVKSVIEKKEPVVLSNALNDQEFSSSLSVINYRLTSVMCTPLTYQGHTFGAIYVGNNSFVNAFDRHSLELMTIFSSQAALLVQNALHINALKKRTKKLMESLELTKFGGMIGGCHGMQAVFQQVEKIASTDISILIVGEPGTGKELIAREIHHRSARNAGPFVVFSCGAISEQFLESELFGAVRGAFLGATQTRTGKVHAAHGGSLFLDEISELPEHLQIKLLRVIQEGHVTKLGDQRSEAVDLRIMAATTRDLLNVVQQEQFREDLYYRLNQMEIKVPPLKERGNDILVMANFFWQKYAKIYGKDVIGMEEEAQNALLNYDWPGNVRELENRIRRAIVMCDHQRITVTDLDIVANASSKILPLASALEKYRSRYINEALERNAGNRTKTASELGVDPRTIFRHLETKKKDAEV